MLPIPEPWQRLLGEQWPRAQLQQLADFLAAREAAGATIYPPAPCRYAALEHVLPDAVRVVILGQDPYHGPGQAHGLAFSVPDGVPLPPSLRNIFKEIERDLGTPVPQSGNLTRWARQGVLLLNTVLTVESGQAGAHRKRGWEALTDALVSRLAATAPPTVFMLWGNDAQSKQPLIPTDRHCVLTSPHPSPLSAHRGFFGNGHFSAANRFLAAHGRSTVDW
jgi:uracil-DNA glycosylase